MNKYLFSLLFFLIINQQTEAQILPKEGSLLNFRLIGFSCSAMPQVSNYSIEIATGTYNTETSFKKNIFKSVSSKKNKIIAEVTSFDARYTWRIIYKYNNSVETKSKFYHFRTGIIPEIDTNINRLRILRKAKKYKDAYVFLDINKALYDMKGLPIWYLPTPESKDINIRDLKITPQGSITYVIDEMGVYEINYKGDIIWKGPNNGIVSGDSLEHYHHEFTRLKSGHYMALAQNFEYWENPTTNDSNLIIVPKDKIKPEEINTEYTLHPMGTLIEYDKNGKVVWSWKSSDYFNGSTIFYHKNHGGSAIQMHAHENSFFFDETSKAIYLSCRNLDRIIKIKYPEGNIVHIYGGDSAMGKGFFCGQHSCRISKKGYLYLFNNNNCNPGKLPAILMMKEPISDKDSMKKVWEYECSVTAPSSNGYPSGGNVIELPDYSLFVSMAYPDSRVFILTMDKEILWSAVAEKFNAANKKWESVNLFRASIIPSRTELERLIWNSESY